MVIEEALHLHHLKKRRKQTVAMLLILLGVCFYICISLVSYLQVEELQLIRVSFGNKDTNGFELSGATIYGQKILVVGDSSDNHYIYCAELSENGEHFSLRPYIDLSSLTNYWDYQNLVATHRLDLEGIAAVGSTIYLADERTRNVLMVDTQAGSLDFYRIPARVVHKGDDNAGLEGIAFDSQGNMVIAKEREPSALIFIQTDNSQTSRYLLHSDVSGLFVVDNYLYALRRNKREILKFNLTTMQPESRVSYRNSAPSQLYESDEPEYGIAEALIVTDDQIIIGVDNNEEDLRSNQIASGNPPSLLFFKRPEGF